MIPSIYVSPGEAEQKLNTADILKRAVLVYGSCGFGKTTLIRHYLEDRVCLFTDVFEKNWMEGYFRIQQGDKRDPKEVYKSLQQGYGHEHPERVNGFQGLLFGRGDVFVSKTVLEKMIRETGYEPVERDTFYHEIAEG